MTTEIITTTTIAEPPPDPTVPASNPQIGFGINFAIGGQTIDLSLPDVIALKNPGAEYTFGLNPGQTIKFGSVSTMYDGAKAVFAFLPAVDWDSYPAPVPALVKQSTLEITQFRMTVRNADTVNNKLGGIVKLAFAMIVLFNDWSIPNFPTLKLKSTSLSVEYTNTAVQ